MRSSPGPFSVSTEQDINYFKFSKLDELILNTLRIAHADIYDYITLRRAGRLWSEIGILHSTAKQRFKAMGHELGLAALESRLAYLNSVEASTHHDTAFCYHEALIPASSAKESTA